MKKIFYVLLASFAITACATSNVKYFSKIAFTNDSTFAYTPENPVRTSNGDLQNSLHSSYYYLSRLRTKDNQTLKIVGRASVDNPNYDENSPGLPNRFSGKRIGGSSPILDRYELVPENNGQDTIIIYINPYDSGNLYIPVNLLFEPENVPDKKRSR